MKTNENILTLDVVKLFLYKQKLESFIKNIESELYYLSGEINTSKEIEFLNSKDQQYYQGTLSEYKSILSELEAIKQHPVFN